MVLCSLIEKICTKEENDKTGCNFNFGHQRIWWIDPKLTVRTVWNSLTWKITRADSRSSVCRRSMSSLQKKIDDLLRQVYWDNKLQVIGDVLASLLLIANVPRSDGGLCETQLTLLTYTLFSPTHPHTLESKETKTGTLECEENGQMLKNFPIRRT